MPSRSVAASASRSSGRARRQVSRAEAEHIRTRRARLIAELNLLRRSHNAPPPLLAKAQELLTRWWSSADWVGRKELLKAADWLIRLEQRRGGGTGESA